MDRAEESLRRVLFAGRGDCALYLLCAADLWATAVGVAVLWCSDIQHARRLRDLLSRIVSDAVAGLGFERLLNGGRLVAALGLHEVGRLKSWLGGSHLPLALSLLSLTYLLGLVVIAFMPETKDRPLPEDGQPAAVPAS